MAANTEMKILKNVGMLIIIVILAAIASSYSGSLYYRFFVYRGGLFSLDLSSAQFLIGLPMAYLFFLFLLFTASGGTKKYWWAGIASIPALAFLIFFDFDHIYFHILFPVAGWLIGYLISKLLAKSTHY